jgi:hypothetical protein
MRGDPGYFETIGNRLGFEVKEQSADRIRLVWRGGRFPGFLCLGIASALLFLTVPILEAIRLRGFGGPAISLWYFPVMNLTLLGLAVFLIFLERTVVADRRSSRVILSKRSLLRRRVLTVEFDEISAVWLGIDSVYSGLAVAGSTTGQKFFPALTLRLVLKSGVTVLLERGGKRRIEDLARRLSRFLGKPATESR